MHCAPRQPRRKVQAHDSPDGQPFSYVCAQVISSGEEFADFTSRPEPRIKLIQFGAPFALSVRKLRYPANTLIVLKAGNLTLDLTEEVGPDPLNTPPVNTTLLVYDGIGLFGVEPKDPMVRRMIHFRGGYYFPCSVRLCSSAAWYCAQLSRALSCCLAHTGVGMCAHDVGTGVKSIALL